MNSKIGTRWVVVCLALVLLAGRAMAKDDIFIEIRYTKPLLIVLSSRLNITWSGEEKHQANYFTGYDINIAVTPLCAGRQLKPTIERLIPDYLRVGLLDATYFLSSGVLRGISAFAQCPIKFIAGIYVGLFSSPNVEPGISNYNPNEIEWYVHTMSDKDIRTGRIVIGEDFMNKPDEFEKITPTSIEHAIQYMVQNPKFSGSNAQPVHDVYLYRHYRYQDPLQSRGHQVTDTVDYIPSSIMD